MDDKYPDQTRNLNPIPEAKVAMIIWGDEYAAQRGGSMDFWDSLDQGRKAKCGMVVRALVDMSPIDTGESNGR